jgi:glycerol kinase
VFVPALSGLGAPTWDPEARGLICGLTRGSGAGQIARATLEAIAFQVADLVSAMREDLGSAAPEGSGGAPESSREVGVAVVPAAGRSAERGMQIRRIRVDGGAAQNNLLMQFQSDVSDVWIERPLDLESTARGAALLAGVGAGVFRGVKEVAQMVEHPQRFEPQMNEAERAERLQSWHTALVRTRSSLSAPELASRSSLKSASLKSPGLTSADPAGAASTSAGGSADSARKRGASQAGAAGEKHDH